MINTAGNFLISLDDVYGLNKYKSRGRVKCTFTIKQILINLQAYFFFIYYENSNFFL